MTEQMPIEPNHPDTNSCAACGSKIIEQSHLTLLCAAEFNQDGILGTGDNNDRINWTKINQ